MSRENENVLDAYLLNSKRISHGTQLFRQPGLTEEIKKSDVCIEVCPFSNMMLGFVNDLRHHPARYMIARGVQISLNSGHPGLFGYDDVSFDYLAAFVAWDLTIRDLKKLSMNGIQYSSCDDDIKMTLLGNVFNKKWKNFIDWVIEMYEKE